MFDLLEPGRGRNVWFEGKLVWSRLGNKDVAKELKVKLQSLRLTLPLLAEFGRTNQGAHLVDVRMAISGSFREILKEINPWTGRKWGKEVNHWNEEWHLMILACRHKVNIEVSTGKMSTKRASVRVRVRLLVHLRVLGENWCVAELPALSI